MKSNFWYWINKKIIALTKKNRLALMKIGFHFKSIGKIKWLFIVYFLITLIGSLLLFLPISQQDNVDVSYINALFTSASAFSDTGLTTMTTATTWSHFGQAVIAILILVGGIGFFALKIYFINWIFGWDLHIFGRGLLNIERGSYNVGATKRIVVVSINILFIFILLSTIVLTIFFYVSPANFDVENKIANTELSPQWNFGNSLRFAIFHSITALNNAGFDIMGNHSISPYYSSYFLQIWLLLLFVFGGIGYPVIYDLYCLIYYKFIKKTRYKISLFSKISLWMYFSLSIIGVLLVYIFEMTSQDPNSFWNKTSGNSEHWNYNYGSKIDKAVALFFSTSATRSAGFFTLDFYDLTSPSLLIMTILMFIGAAPSSTGGGIRVTTFAIIILGLWSKMTSKPSVQIFKRKIPEKTVIDSFIVLILSILLILIISLITYSSSTLFNSIDQGQLPIDPSGDAIKGGVRTYGIIHIVFEVASAFGTTGISTGVTSGLNITSKIFFILLMFIGQLGISSTILVWAKNNNRTFKFNYPSEDVLIG